MITSALTSGSPVSRLLPYDAILVPLTYFFIRNEEGEPSSVQDKLLAQYVWWASLSNSFTSAAESKIAQDLLRIDDILVETPPNYKDEEIHLGMDDLRWRRFRAGDAFCKAILCLYAYYEPKSFQSNGLVKLDNSWLRTAASTNYHHFFPKDYLAKTGGYPDERANSILNITLVDDYLNKRPDSCESSKRVYGIVCKEEQEAEGNDEDAFDRRPRRLRCVG